MSNDLRLIEDYLPIEAISAEASREKSVRKGHISTLHLWWARRPLVACRAAVYGALVQADRWVSDLNMKEDSADNEKIEAKKNGKKRGLNRRQAKEFVTRLCRYPNESDLDVKADTERAIADAQKHILEAHAKRLTDEIVEWRNSGVKPAWIDEFKFTGDNVAVADIEAGRAPRPRVIDMFAGGGAIPLEALRLGCEAYALDLNPVAHIIQLCTLVYPQKYGRADPNERGMTGEKNSKGETTWGGLAEEVRYWGNYVLKEVKKEIGDLYPPIPDPAFKGKKPEIVFDKKIGNWVEKGKKQDKDLFGEIKQDNEIPKGYLQPVAYLWTRTVKCKNPGCGATVPLVRQTWLCKKKDRYVALKMIAPRGKKEVRFEVVEAKTEKALGFDPAAFSAGGNATCPFCGTVADSDYVKEQGMSGKMKQQFMAIATIKKKTKGKKYLDTSVLADSFSKVLNQLDERTKECQQKYDVAILNEPIEINPRSMDIDKAGFSNWADIFTGRQQLALTALSGIVSKNLPTLLYTKNIESQHLKALSTMLGCGVGKFADFCSTLCMFNYTGGRGVKNSFPQQSLPLVWDFAETYPFNPEGASISSVFEGLYNVIISLQNIALFADVKRGSALNLSAQPGFFDAIITDPPYYDNVSYSNLSDFFYVWLKRAVGRIYPEHFATELTPKKSEAIAASYRHGGDKSKANGFYEKMMFNAFSESYRILKPNGPLVVVYAHKTTLGWATLVDALRKASFSVDEAWPLDTERKGRVIAMDTAALASSIFLVARKRPPNSGIGNYEESVQPELIRIVRERVDTLWEMGISGADLVIACVGAGLRAFTKYEKVEYANGEEVPAEKFLAEVEGAVLDTMMGKLFNLSGGNVSAVDPSSRFYILWRFVYKVAEIDAGEAIVFTYAQHVELDGATGLSGGKDALVEKKKAKYRARDFTERGSNAKLGISSDDGRPAPLIDCLHRILWLMEKSPKKIAEFLKETKPDIERLRIIAQSLAGAALSGKSEEDSARLVSTTPAEQSALGKLLANWKNVLQDSAITESKQSKEDAAQQRLDL